MIIVSVKLVSAIDPSRDKELARMIICNDGVGDEQTADYTAATFHGRDKETLDQLRIQKTGKIIGWKRQQFHVWNLVRKALENMNYTKGK